MKLIISLILFNLLYLTFLNLYMNILSQYFLELTLVGYFSLFIFKVLPLMFSLKLLPLLITFIYHTFEALIMITLLNNFII
jgi:hypothetical protein